MAPKKKGALAWAGRLTCLTLVILILTLAGGAVAVWAMKDNQARAGSGPRKGGTGGETTKSPNAQTYQNFDEAKKDGVCAELQKPFFNKAGKPVNSTRKIDVFNREGNRFNVSPVVVAAISEIESTFIADVVSSSDARGIMQLKDVAWRDVTELVDYPNVSFAQGAFDPEKNVHFGTAYWTKLRDVYLNKSDLQTIAGHYNQGPGGNIHNQEGSAYMQNFTTAYNKWSKCVDGPQLGGPSSASNVPVPKKLNLDTRYLMSGNNLKLYTEKIVPPYLKRKSYPLDSATISPKWIVLHTTQGTGIDSEFMRSISPEILATPDKSNPNNIIYDHPDRIVHYQIDGGTVYQFLPTNIISRGAAGFNHVSINIEMSGDAAITLPTETTDQAALLVEYLMKTYGIDRAHVISHGDIDSASRRLENRKVPAVTKGVNIEEIWADYNRPTGTYGSEGRTDPGIGNMQTILDKLDKLTKESK